MENSKKIEVQLSTGTHFSRGTLAVRQLATGECISQALIRFVLGMVITVIVLFIPGLHFILAPLALVGTIFAVVRAMKGGQRIEAIEATCPACNAQFRVMPRPFRLPFQDVCEACRRQVVLSLH